MAGEEFSQQSQEALANLCRKYWYPLYAFVRRQGYSPKEAQDLTQGFFTRLLEPGHPNRRTPLQPGTAIESHARKDL